MPYPKSVFDFINKLHRIQGFPALLKTIMEGLHSLIPGDNVMVGRHDASRRMMSGIVLRHPFSHANFLPEANDTGLLGFHPFWNRVLDPGNPLKILSEMTTGRQWHENPFYRSILRPDHVRDHINIEFGTAPEDFISVGILRSRVGFVRRERETMVLLRPHFALAFDNTGYFERRLGGISTGAWSGAESVTLSPGQTKIPTAFEKRLRHLLGERADSALPSFQRWLANGVDSLNRGALFASSRGWRARTGDRMIFFELRREGPAFAYRLYFHFEQLPDRSCEFRLTNREQQVLLWLAEGKTNAEIANHLDIGHETVKTHLKHIFLKLGVDNRTAAARTVMETTRS